jgi:hypothetical protein
VQTRFALTSDVDVLFAVNYLTQAVAALKADPYQVILSQCLDLPPEALPQLERLAEPLDMTRLTAMASPRNEQNKPSFGINCTYTRFYHLVQGYDEFFQLWGSEDNDLMRRFFWLSLKITSIADNSSYLHQWHAKHEGVISDQLQATLKRNIDYEYASRKIIANDANWGMPIEGTG